MKMGEEAVSHWSYALFLLDKLPYFINALLQQLGWHKQGERTALETASNWEDYGT